MKVARIIGTIIFSGLIGMFLLGITASLIKERLGAALWGVAFIILCVNGIIKIWVKKKE